MSQAVDGETIDYLWDHYSRYGDVLLETDAGGAPLVSYTLANGQLISQVRDGLPSYYLTDGQGSVRALTDANGAISDTYAYTAFGELYAQTGALENSYLYTGQQFDGLTGLYSLRARYYDPGLGRFLSQDTAGVLYGNPVELNRYLYVANNPINMFDPTGRQQTIERIIVSKMIWAAVGVLFLNICIATHCIEGFASALELLIRTLRGMIRDLIQQLLEELLGDDQEQVGSRSGEVAGEEEKEGAKEVEAPKKCVEGDPDCDGKYFYYAEVGFVWRDSSDILNDLAHYIDIPGIEPGVAGELRAAENIYEGNKASTSYFLLVGRKMEAERAIYYAQRNMLVRAIASNHPPDFTIRNFGFGNIRYVEVKWTSLDYLRDDYKQKLQSAINAAGNGELLVEYNKIGPNLEKDLIELGGVRFPGVYPP